MTLLVNILALGAFTLCCYGWGSVAHIICYPGRTSSPAYIVALGLVPLAFVGGILNLAQLAFAVSLAICAYAGILLAIVSMVWFRVKLPEWIYLVVLSAFGIFLAATLLPAPVFNFHDDFLSYLPRIMRLRQFGTVGGNPFELLGLSDLGLQSFFQALLATWLPIESSFAFDTIFCFLLGLWLLIEIGRANKYLVIPISLATMVYALIDPQIVNVTSVYSTVVLLLALHLATRILLDRLRGTAPLSQLIRCALPVGGIIAAIVAIKLTSPFFLTAFCGIIFVYLLTASWRAGGAAVLTAIAAMSAVLAPWVLIHGDKFKTLFRNVSDTTPDPLAVYPSISNAFHSQPSLYGATRAHYAIALVGLLISLIASVRRLYQKPRDSLTWLNVAMVIGAIAAYFGLAGVVNDEMALRYAIPFLIAVVPTTIIFQPSLLPLSGKYLNGIWQKGYALATGCCVLVLFVAFAGYGGRRLWRVLQLNSVVSFPVSQQTVTLEAAALSEEERTYLRGIQSRLPAGSIIWAWVDAPFQLDFGRNQVFHFSHDWFGAPWHPPVRTPEVFAQDLIGRKVDYIVWQYQTVFGLRLPTLQEQLKGSEWAEYRTIHENTMRLLLTLQSLAKPNNIIFNDGRTVVISLKSASGN